MGDLAAAQGVEKASGLGGSSVMLPHVITYHILHHILFALNSLVQSGLNRDLDL